MPSQPDPNSPFMPSRLQADFGIRAPGTPTSAGKPGLQPGDVQFPAPPAPAASPVGRPPTPGMPTPTSAPPTAPQSPPTFGAGVPSGQPSSTPEGAPAGTPAAAPPTGAPLVVPTPTAADGERFALSPEGDMRYREAIVRGRGQMGPVPSIFRNPNLPEMPFELGQSNFNPFTGQFTKG